MGFTTFVSDFTPSIGVAMSAMIGLVLTLVVLRMTRYWKYKLPPGPPGYPLIGNIREMKGKEVHKLFVEWSKKYGPVLSVYYGPELYIILNNLEVLQEALVKKQNDFAGRPHTALLDVISDGGRSIVVSEGPQWKMHRKLLVSGLRKFLRSNLPEDAIHTNLAAIEDLILKEKEPIDPTEYILLVIVNTLCTHAFGTSLSFEDEDFQKICNFSRSVVDNPEFSIPFENYVPFLRRCPTKGFKEMMKVFEWFFSFIAKKIEEHRQSLDPKNIRDLTDAVLVAQAEEQQQGNDATISLITNRHIIQTVNDVFGGGMDTVRLTLTYALKYMAAYPEIQAKVHEEVKKVVGYGRFPRVSDKDELVYVQAILREVLRLHTVLPLAAPHRTTCDTSVGGYDVPKGVIVTVNLWALHHDSEHWKNPHIFYPERFLDDNWKLAPKPPSFIPFGLGSRSCVGENLAFLQMTLILARFIQRFRIRFPKGAEWNMEDKMGFMVMFPTPFKLVFEER